MVLREVLDGLVILDSLPFGCVIFLPCCRRNHSSHTYILRTLPVRTIYPHHLPYYGTCTWYHRTYRYVFLKAVYDCNLVSTFKVQEAGLLHMSGTKSVAQLKAALKAVGLSMTGEKDELVQRLNLHAAGEIHKLDGQNPTLLKAGELKKALAIRGLPCDLSIQSRDELLAALIGALKSESGGSAGDSQGGSGHDSETSAAEMAVDLAKKVLSLGESCDFEGVLSVLGTAITRQTPFAQIRKAYLNLARVIHPDKILRQFDGATRAFQMLVRAFDELSAPEPSKAPAATSAKPKEKTLGRSNSGCFRTVVSCPRCDSVWGTADSGVQPYDYTLLMQGLKTYCCALCLCGEHSRSQLYLRTSATDRHPPPHSDRL